MIMNRLLSQTIPNRYIPVLATVLALTLSGCGDKQGPIAPPPPPEVGVMTVTLGTVGLGTELPGRLHAFRLAEVRARAAGIVLKRHFEEGSDVKAGQMLFSIDPTPYRIALASAQANLSQASALLQRYGPLLAENAISKQEYDNALASEKMARAQVEAASMNLGYANVVAPISGRIGQEMVTEGALVGQGQPTQLATIQQIDPLYINVSQSASEVLQLRQAVQAGKLISAGADGKLPVSVILENGQKYAHKGRLLFTASSVDQDTGQVLLRAELPNPDKLLLPGMYVRVRLDQVRAENAVLVPQQAVTRGAQGDTVLVVAADGTFSPRPVKISQSQNNSWVVTGGLQEGEKVMVDGFMRLRPGVTKVKPVVANAASTAASGAASAAAPATGVGALATVAPVASAAASQ